MSAMSPANDHPRPDTFTDTFWVYEVEIEEDTVRYYGEPMTAKDRVVDRLAPVFREAGYRVTMTHETGEHVLIAQERSPGVQGIPWLNVVLFVATLGTTLLAGSMWYGLPVGQQPLSVFGAWPFAVAVLGVVGIHELGHYVLSRHHDVQASLPYFIPIPNLLGTLGAVIRMKDHLPSRTALFDIGVAGPLAGLVATVAVTAVGVSLPPIEVGGDTLAQQVELGYPPLVHIVSALVGGQLRYADPTLMVNPVVVGGWVGAFVTFLNLLPVGQLDGAHVLRALVGDRFDTVQLVVPAALFALAGGLFVFAGGQAAGIWLLWGVLALVFTRVGGVSPIDDSEVGRSRKLLAAVTLVLGVLSFTPVPITIAG